MNHYLYRVEDRETGEHYIGVRSCRCAPEEDVDYRGSGTLVRRKVAKHPERFIKFILDIAADRAEALAIEALLVNDASLQDPLCLNLVEGGQSGVPGLKHRPEAQRKMSDAAKARWANPCERTKQAIRRLGKRHCAETRSAYSEARRGERHPMFGEKHTADARAKISDHKRGEKHPLATMTDELVYAMREARAAGESSREIAARLGLNYRTVRSAVGGQSWKHVPFPPHA